MGSVVPGHRLDPKWISGRIVRAMGIIDTHIYEVKCDSCGATGTGKVYDKGNRFSGPDWPLRGHFDDFDSEWGSGSSEGEPELISVTCKKCGGKASVVKEYYRT